MLGHHIGGIMYRPGEGKQQHENHKWLQENSKIPLLIAANLEYGGNGIATDGTNFATQMEVAATGDAEYAYHLGKISAKEGKACGCNIAFAPVVDIDRNWRNPITNVRTYGSDPEFVLKCALSYKKGADEEGVASTIKHFPGDGCDEVDQHISSSVNNLSCEEWDATYGKIYKTLIDEGAKTVMVGHIAMPAYQMRYDKEGQNKLIPASLSPALLKGLLREQLGFNGMIITDSTCMIGFSCAMAREKALPYCIEAGCDMLLFNKVLDEDYHILLRGYEQGLLSEERLNEAVTRILALKASIGLLDKDKKDIVPDASGLAILGSKESVDMALECADKAITLVKDTQGALPLSPEKTKRVLLEILGDFPSNEHVINKVKAKLEHEGFIVDIYEKEGFGKNDFSVATFRNKYDLVIYLGNVENASNKVTNRINWHTFFGNGNNCPWFVEEKPTVFVSFANPYHLVDVPMIRTYINCYSNNDSVLEMLVEKLMGRSEFKGVSPIDPFCGKEYLKY
jgi:beta-N-acetylhexosaminidase